MLRVLVSAYACEPGRGSEGEIGWSLVHELAKRNEVWVLTRANNRPVHEAVFNIHGKPETLHFLYYDTPRWARWYKRGKRLFLLYYYLWQVGSFFEARRFIRRERIDLVHHLTGGMDWMPSGLAFLGKPFIWGPVGSEEIHPAILATLPLAVRLKELVRKAVRACGRHVDPLVRMTGSRARLILSHTPENLPRRHAGKVFPYVQTGIHPTPRFARMKTSLGREDRLTVIYAGELVHWKGAAYAVDAFLECARARCDARLIIIGDGPLRPRLERRVVESGLDAQVEFRGRVPMETLVETLGRGDVFLYPSYHHGLATVVLQAMLTGLPVICLEGDAIGRAITSECGITVPVTRGSHFVQGIAAALASLMDDESRRVASARRGQEIAMARYSYETIGAGYEHVYRSVMRDSPR